MNEPAVPELEPEPEPVEGKVMTEEEVDRMRILSWWKSYSRKSGD